LNQRLRRTLVAILLAGLSALMYGAADFCGGLASRRAPLFTVLVFSQIVGLLIAVSAALAFRQSLPAPADVLWGAAAGVCGAAGLAALYRALATTLVAVASPVAAVTGTIIPVLIGLALGERPGALAWVGIGLAVPAIVLLAAGPVEHAQKGIVRGAMLLGTAAGVGFGLFFVAISRTSSASGLWPLAAARLATITLVVFTAVLARRSLRPARGGFLIVLLCGALDMGANIAFLLATRVGLLSITAVVTSLYPGPTVLLALLVFRERLTVPRVLGLTLALAGVALISV
jgi:drug/metabolite transporter (DMT)-like permease